MGKFNNNRRPTYFQRQIARMGPDFLKTSNSAELERGAIQVFKDLARGNISNDEFQYFLDNQFLECCIKSAWTKFRYYTTNYNGDILLMYNPAQQPEQDLQLYLNHNQNCMEAYRIIYNNLIEISRTKDLSYLNVMISQLRAIRGVQNYI